MNECKTKMSENDRVRSVSSFESNLSTQATSIVDVSSCLLHSGDACTPEIQRSSFLSGRERTRVLFRNELVSNKCSRSKKDEKRPVAVENNVEIDSWDEINILTEEQERRQDEVSALIYGDRTKMGTIYLKEVSWYALTKNEGGAEHLCEVGSYSFEMIIERSRMTTFTTRQVVAGNS